MAALRVGVVPEHFCAPLHIAAADGVFRAHGVDVELVECPGGTGQVGAELAGGKAWLGCGATTRSIARGPDAGHWDQTLGMGGITNGRTWPVLLGDCAWSALLGECNPGGRR